MTSKRFSSHSVRYYGSMSKEAMEKTHIKFPTSFFLSQDKDDTVKPWLRSSMIGWIQVPLSIGLSVFRASSTDFLAMQM